MKPSAISWADFSGGNLNFVSGCTPVSESCTNCYARAIYERFGKDFSKVTWSDHKLCRAICGTYLRDSEWLDIALTTKRGYGRNPICFCCDTGDLFHEAVPLEFIVHAFDLMAGRTDVDWVILTKRTNRMAEVMDWILCESGAYMNINGLLNDHKWPPQNIWLGVTCENQARADERIPILLEHWAGPKFVSVEPMLGPVSMASIPGLNKADSAGQEIVRQFWVICGAESGPNRRPFEVEWAKDLYEQCQRAGVKFYGKQDSGLYPGTPLLIDGKVIHEWPESR